MANLEQSWRQLQAAVDMLYWKSRQEKRAIWPGYAGTAIRALFALRYKHG